MLSFSEFYYFALKFEVCCEETKLGPIVEVGSIPSSGSTRNPFSVATLDLSCRGQQQRARSAVLELVAASKHRLDSKHHRRSECSRPRCGM